MAQKRFIPRQRKRFKLSLGGGKLPSFTADVSPGGFAVEVAHVQRPGTETHGHLHVEGREFPFTGVVSWAQQGDPRLSVRGRMGIRFTGIDNDFFAVFQRITER